MHNHPPVSDFARTVLICCAIGLASYAIAAWALW